jgi:hypothetical protein
MCVVNAVMIYVLLPMLNKVAREADDLVYEFALYSMTPRAGQLNTGWRCAWRDV